MIKVCDALCGSGKTSACIKMMNERTDVRFIFVTQFLKEVDRIKRGCTARDFISPVSDVKTGHTKLADVHRLLRAGRNIATTHALFMTYTEETKKLIQDQNYVLVLDESVDVLCDAYLSDSDIKILQMSNAIVEKDGNVEWVMNDYDMNDEIPGKFREEMIRARSKNFMRFEGNSFFWSIPPELFTCFNDVYILTYMFYGQPLKCFFEIHGIEYCLIGVRQTEDGYIFCSTDEMDRRVDLRSKIHILEDEKMNAIGEGRTALSVSWYKSAAAEASGEKMERLRKNIINLYRNIYSDSSGKRLWTTFKSFEPSLKGNGYRTCFIPYNLRASNSFADKKYLAYCVNNFPRPFEKRFFFERGSEWASDPYALSILVQWLFRSAIRRGEEVWIYVPSERMRCLLKQWLDKLAEGKDLEPVFYKTNNKLGSTRKKRGRPSKKQIMEESEVEDYE